MQSPSQLMPRELPQRMSANSKVKEIINLEKETEWQEIQRQLDRDYQKKVKMVNDEAMKRLDDYSMEH